MILDMLLCALLQIAPGDGAGVPETLAAITAIERTRPGPAQIGMLNRALDSDLAAARRLGRLSPMQRDAFSRASSYLSGVGPSVDPSIRIPMAQAWRRVGEGMELGGSQWDRSGALAGYRNSFLWMEQYPGQNPADATFRGDLYFVAGRVRALGGTIPIWASVPIGGDQPSRPRGFPDEYVQPPERAETVRWIEIPKDGLDAVERQAVIAVEQKINGATVSVMAARGVVDGLRSRLAAQGLQLNAVTAGRYEGMLASYEQARTAVQERRWSAATEMADVAAGYARRILGEAGQ